MVERIGGSGNDRIRGTRGNDLLRGADGDDTLIGLGGDDTLIGDRGDDIMRANSGNDRMIWNNGDGSDIMRGSRGFDVVEVNGSLEDGDNFELRANGARVEFERLNLGPFELNVDDVEQFEINGGGGDDTLTVQDLTGTDVQQVIFNGGDGNDSLDASLSNVEIIANGGAGNDYLSGSSVREITDTLEGGDGNDTIIGNRGDDLKIGGEGDDRLIWNNGDGSDIMEGDNGFDVVEVNGALEDGDNFELRANGEHAQFERLNLGNFVLDVDNVEQFEINGGGGDDTLTVQDLTGTDVQQVIFNGGDGNDWLNGSETYVNIMASGGEGNDTLTGGNGSDVLTGGNGNDMLEGNRGADIFVLGFTGIDQIVDFNFQEGDRIRIMRAEFGISSLDELSYDQNNQGLYNGNEQIATIASATPFDTQQIELI
jgi:Ca2+-binding RTX toxin-like protein